jgi:ATP-dependent helicase Lhr and Lhr-like helicase
VVDVGHRRDLDLALELPEGELEAVASAEQLGDVLDRIAALVRQHRSTLVFVNTRSLAERLAHQLGERLGDDVVSAHHGSLSKERRLRVETRLRSGELKALVATGRAGVPDRLSAQHRHISPTGGPFEPQPVGTPKGRLFPLTRDELVECTALLTAVRAGRLDAIQPARLPLDIMAQQLVAEVAARQRSTDDLYQSVRRAAPYSQLSRAQFDEVLDLVS